MRVHFLETMNNLFNLIESQQTEIMFLRIDALLLFKIIQKVLSEKLLDLLISFVMINDVLFDEVDLSLLLLIRHFGRPLLFLFLIDVSFNLLLLVVLHEGV